MREKIWYCFLLYTLGLGCAPLTGQHLSAIKTSEGIEVSEGSSKVLFYQIRAKSQNGKFERANYIHPLYSLNGKILTEDFPADHPHHHGIFWAWHQILHNNKPIADGWTSENISWEVRKSDVKRKKSSITLNNEVVWKSVLVADQPEAIVRENSKIIVYASKGDYRIIDFEISLAALKENLKLGGSDDPKGYGGFSWRITLPENIRMLNRTTEIMPQELAVDGGPWLDFVGSLEGKNDPESGVAVFCHPSNPGHPQPWILRRQKSMQNLAFPGREAVELLRTGLRLRYRVIIHRNNVNPGAIEKLYQEYAPM